MLSLAKACAESKDPMQNAAPQPHQAFSPAIVDAPAVYGNSLPGFIVVRRSHESE